MSFFSVLESLQELEDNDLDALMADLMADLNTTELKFAAERDELKVPSPPMPDLPPKRVGAVPASSTSSASSASSIAFPTSPEVGNTASSVSSPASPAASPLPAPPPHSAKPTMVSHFFNSLNKTESFSETSQEPALVKMVFNRTIKTQAEQSALILQRQLYAKRIKASQHILWEFFPSPWQREELGSHLGG